VPSVDVIIQRGLLDWRPKETAGHKIKKGRGFKRLNWWRIRISWRSWLQPGNSPCIWWALLRKRRDLISERTENSRKNLDLIVVNDVSREDAGFEADTRCRKSFTRGPTWRNCLDAQRRVAGSALDRIKSLREKSV